MISAQCCGGRGDAEVAFHLCPWSPVPTGAGGTAVPRPFRPHLHVLLPQGGQDWSLQPLFCIPSSDVPSGAPPSAGGAEDTGASRHFSNTGVSIWWRRLKSELILLQGHRGAWFIPSSSAHTSSLILAYPSTREKASRGLRTALAQEEKFGSVALSQVCEHHWFGHPNSPREQD